ncbi:MAG: citramalate synthase [Candidatus Omnitrophica bacterium]|nr:citramalate synthase [Candidatus Omnitrophota bacterium]
MSRIIIYDTTLRDGSQTEGVSYSVNDKIKITHKLDELGVHYIEGGWPGSNPKDKEYFALMKGVTLKNAQLASFGSTRRAHIKPQDDANLKELIASQTPIVTIFGKTWDLHVIDVLKTTLPENLLMIQESVVFLKKNQRKVFYDAEHFFDGYKSNPKYALKTILAAQSGGAECIILCDTNGGSLPDEITKIVKEVKKKIKKPLGIHTHNDQGLAVANSLAGINAGCVQVQGTFNGLGERCGNADLCTIMAILHSKMNKKSIAESNIKLLMDTAYYIGDISNYTLADNHPFIGHSAFAHKGGVHIDAMLKNPLAYEHVDPGLVGNRRRLLTSELAGKMPIILKAQKMNIPLDKNSPVAREIMKELQEKEYQGYQYEGADASFELFMKRRLNMYEPFYKLEGFKVFTEKKIDGSVLAGATVRLKVNNHDEMATIEGHGPVEVLDRALRTALKKFYPTITDMHLSDYKVRVIDTQEGTAARVRVLIESQDQHGSWTTVGVHENVIEASWEALVDSIEYKLLKDKKSS